jgi:hypothetical protein
VLTQAGATGKFGLGPSVRLTGFANLTAQFVGTLCCPTGGPIFRGGALGDTSFASSSP